MRIGFCELPCGLMPDTALWRTQSDALAALNADMLILNEMPFGPWLPLSASYLPDQAAEAVKLHEHALAALRNLGTRIVISSRPVHAGDRLANEAFALVDGDYVALHHKHYFPDEPCFYEQRWFTPERPGFEVHLLPGIRLGAQLCTELMFNEWARHYGRSGAQLIVAPRASGVSTLKWQAALSMAAVVSGCYVISSNRSGQEAEMTFGGRGFAYAPGGEMIAATSASDPFQVIDIDLGLVAEAQADWPCNVAETVTE